MMIEAYPLHWPEGWSRTRAWHRSQSKFKNSFARARDELLDEIERLRGRYHRSGDPILSTNVALRQDGLPYANQREPEDSGVAVYFKYKDKDMCFACDKYKKVWENMVAITKTIEAIRGIERWGASDMMERAFRGFVALPASTGHWSEILGVPRNASTEQVMQAYRQLAQQHHPDKANGNADQFIKINQAKEAALIEVQGYA